MIKYFAYIIKKNVINFYNFSGRCSRVPFRIIEGRQFSFYLILSMNTLNSFKIRGNVIFRALFLFMHVHVYFNKYLLILLSNGLV